MQAVKGSADPAGQIPFVTDDSVMTPKSHWNFQFVSEYASRLPGS